ncbi:MAG: hypothetical protein H6625_06125 [Bdellovibrionaceae bacterium]|nr:hypothetical protein [Pseudobdellovibrionaceae bacterium]
MKKSIVMSVLVSLLSFALISEAAPGRGHRGDRGGGRGPIDNGRDDRRLPPQSERLVIEMGDSLYQGRDNIIYLKRELMAIYPRMDFQNMELDGVRIVAKSRHGMGTAELVVGQVGKDRKRVGGRPEDFHSNWPYTYDRVELDNYGSSMGAWQIHLDGNIKVKRVVVFVSVDRRDGGYRPPRMRYLSAGEGSFDKIGYNKRTFAVNLSGVEEISIQGENRSLEVRQVRVYFGNGSSQIISGLSGNIREGQIKTVLINSRHVNYIEVEATSLDIFGGLGKLSVEVGYR